MTEREMLELAAKAAGIELEYRHGSDAYYYDDPESGREQWIPLDDDGQAFRLMVKLGICITPYPIYSETERHSVAVKQFRNDDLLRKVNQT